MRYVLQQGDLFVKWIQWTGGVTPHFSFGSFEKALIVDDEYLTAEVHPKIKGNRKAVMLEKYPDLKVVEVVITIKN